VLVRLTAEGRATVDGALANLLDRERELLAGLDARAQERLASLLRDLVAPFEPEQ
jgi:DNA-binding MarR family transcriptional regulator